MPRYHFHSADGRRWSDEEGSELASDEAARVEAVRFAGEMLRGNPTELWRHGQWRVEVTDEENVLLFTIITLAIDAPVPTRRSDSSPRPDQRA